MNKSSVGLVLLASWVLASLLVSPCLASVVLVEDIQFSFAKTVFYDGNAQGFTFSRPAVTGDLSLVTSSLYEYSIHGAVVSFSDSALISDNSVGGVANGTFAGGVTLTVTGRLVENATNIEYAAAGSTLIIATMDPLTWTIEELFANYASGFAEFTTTAGLLSGSGLEAGNVTMKMDKFVMGFYSSITGELTHFGDSDVVASAPWVLLHIPEPATVGLFSMGLLFLSRKRKNV